MCTCPVLFPYALELTNPSTRWIIANCPGVVVGVPDVPAPLNGRHMICVFRPACESPRYADVLNQLLASLNSAFIKEWDGGEAEVGHCYCSLPGM